VSLDILDQFHDPALCKSVLDRLNATLTGPLRFMEVCGTHTVAIFRSGLRSLLPKQIVHLSGPGCPVCVTHESEVNAFLDLAEKPGVIIATFGDLMRVPGSRGRTLKAAQADGARVKVVYSPPDAIKLAAENPDAKVVFLGVGFETTAPGVAASLKMAKAQGVGNYRVLSFHKLVPPALTALLSDAAPEPGQGIDAFIMPGHAPTFQGKRLSPRAAIRKNCRWCNGGDNPKSCPTGSCALYEFRLSEVRNASTTPLKAIRACCLDCAGSVEE